MSRSLSASIVLSASLTVTWAIPGTVTSPAFAAPSVDSITDAAAGTEIENSKFQFEGEINANAVYVRSGPSDNDYATAKLDKSAKVTVVGIKFDWLKVLPPEGSFCYVAKAYVEKRGDGTLGRVTNTLNVRVGSTLLPMKTKVASKLEPGQDVQIIGEQDEYFKVRPPTGVFFFVNKQFVDPIRRVEVPGLPAEKPVAEKPADETPKVADAGGAPTTPAIADGGATAPVVAKIDQPPTDGGRETIKVDGGTQPPAHLPAVENADNNANSGVAITDNVPIDNSPVDGGPATQPSAVVPIKEGISPTTQPGAITVSADVQFDQLETRLKEAAQRPIEQQPVPELLAGYQQLVSDANLPESMRRIAEHRVQTLKIHNENHELALAHQRSLQDKAASLISKKAESDELMERLKTTGIIFYSAVGTIRPSMLQGADQTLYRLTDPISGRTVVYIKSNDPSLARMTGLFVGVQGAIADDVQMKLKYITPTDITPVDQKSVNRSVTARIVPPSLQPGGVLAGSSAEEVNR